jgi:hypothetical protein
MLGHFSYFKYRASLLFILSGELYDCRIVICCFLAHFQVFGNYYSWGGGDLGGYVVDE